MKTLREIFDDSGAASAPYNTALKVQICGLGQTSTYRNASGEQRQSITMGIADRTMAAKGMLYDVSKASSLKVGSTLMLLNVIIKRESKTIVMTNRSKLLMTGPFAEAIPAQLLQQGLEFVCPPPSELVAISKIKSSPTKTMVSIRGQVVSEEIERTVKVNGEDTLVRSLKIKDETASCKVSLWREFSKTKTAVGSHLEITNVIVQVYNDEKSVSTTSRSKLLSIAAPDIVKKVTFIAFEMVEGGCLSLTGDQDDGEYPEFIIKGALLAKAIQCKPQDVEARLLTKLPVQAQVTIKEKEIKQIQMLNE